MYKIFAFSFVGLITIITIGSINATSPNILPAPVSSAHNPCADVRNGQFVCRDCATLAYCVQEGGDWVIIDIATCATDRSMYCNEDTKSCTFQRECFLPSQGTKFECQNPGKYPDPYDCRVYHICSSLNVDTRVVCASGTIYTAASQSCIQGSTNSATCRQQQFQCDRHGMMGAWPGDPNIYYICHTSYVNGKVVYYPLMYRCQAGKIFDGQNCVSQSKPPTTTTATTIACKENQLTAHPNNCRAYYRCKNGQLIMEQCPPYTYYNAKGAYCDYGNC